MIFSRDTFLYHPSDGKKLFPQGEQHPGPAWFDNPECIAPSANAPELARRLETAENAVNRLQGEVDAANSQISGQARAHAEDTASLNAINDAALAAKDERIASLEADIETLIAQRDAAAKGLPIPTISEAALPVPVDPDKAELLAIRKELAQLGVEPMPHHATGLAKLREALEAARAEARKAE